MRYDVDFEAEPFQGYTEFDEFEASEFETSDSETPGGMSGELWRQRQRASGRRPRQRPRRRPRATRPSRPSPQVLRLPYASLNILSEPAPGAYGDAPPDGSGAWPSPAFGDDAGAGSAVPPDASSAAGDDAGFGPPPGQSEFDEWEWPDPEAFEFGDSFEFEDTFELLEEISRSSADYVRWVQRSLNQLIGAGLAVDGVSGPLTRGAVQNFQSRARITVDGIVGPQTEGALISAGASPPPGSSTSPGGGAPSYGGGPTGFQFVQIPGIERTTQAFRDKTVNIARDIGIDPNYLMAVMSFESNINPQAVNKSTGATGLIQFIPSTARNLGTSTDALYRMSAEQQLDYVWKYFAPYKGRLRNLEDIYMAVFAGPSAVGKSSSHVLFSTGSDAYRFNSVLDVNRDGRITVGEATSFVWKRLPAGYKSGGGGSTAPPVSTTGINTPLPQAGPGFYSYTTSARRFGLSKTIQAILAIGAAWQRANPNGPMLGIGNISLQGGGPFPPHSSHRKGVDVDIRPVRNDRKNEPVTYKSSAYSRSLTQQLVNLIRSNGVLSVRTILFNDPQVTGVSKYTGHDDHLHVSFNAPS